MAAIATLRAQQGDTLDCLVWRDRGLGPADLGDVLALNPGVAALGATLPLGTAVRVPARAPAPALRPVVQLWD